MTFFPLNNVYYQSICQECQPFFGNAFFRSSNEKRITGVLFVFFTLEKSTKNRMNLFDTLNGHIDSR